MLISEITKTNTPLPQKGLTPILIAPPHTYTTQATISSVKQSKTHVTHLSRRNKATSASYHRPSRSLSSLQRWKADPIFTRVLLLALSRHDKSPTVNCCRILFMTYWHKFQMIFNGHFVTSSVDRPRQDNCRVRCRHGASLLLFRRCFPLLFFIRHLYLSVVARFG